MSKHIIFLFSLLFIFSCTGNRQENNADGSAATAAKDTLTPPLVTILANLPDSLHPKTKALDTMPKPRIVTVPAHSGGSYSITNAKGEVRKIVLEPPANKLLPVLLDAKGEVINDSAGNTFIMGSGGISNFTNFTTDNGLALDAIGCSKIDKAGNLWFGTDGGGVSRYDGKSFTTFSTAQGLANNNVRSITEDKAGNLWFGTQGGGVSRYDGKSFTTFSTAQGLANNTVWSITEDKAGNLWFGTYGGGVSRYDGKSFTTFSTAQGLANNQVWSITEDKAGNLWFGTYGGGVSRYDGKSFTTFSTAQGLANNTVWSITEDKAGNLWFGTDGGGVSRYDGKSFTTFSTAQGLANNNVRSITEDKAGNLWFGTYGGGVSRYDGKSFTTFSTAQGLANNNVRSITEDKAGNLWFGTQGGGVSRYDGKSFTTFSTAQGLANNQVWSITEDKAGNLWFGTAEGLSVMSVDEAKKLQEKNDKVNPKNSPGKRIFKTFTKTNGLPDNFVTQVMQMPEGKMAVGTNLGITLFTPSEDFTKLNDIEIYNSNTGCPVKDVNTGQNCMLLDSKGIIWAGTGSEKTALVRFDPSALHINNDTPTLVIKSIKVNEENICWYNLEKGNETKTDSNVAPAYITEEVTTIGKALTEDERDNMKRRFSATAIPRVINNVAERTFQGCSKKYFSG